MGKKTPLYAKHIQEGAHMVDFGGWDMPLHYGSQLEEHHQVRRDAGLFDVSHMTVVDVLGVGARDYLRYLLANDVDRIKSRGGAIYSCMLNHEGGVIDDLIVYFLDVQHYRVIVNASTRDKDLAWMNEHAHGFSVGLQEHSDLVMFAVQGPNAREKAMAVMGSAKMDAASTLQPFECVQTGHWFIARTGYTGEDGFEIIVPAKEGPELWQRMVSGGVAPCGLGARDTLRLEAGLNLYGQDMDETTTPLESNLGWTVAWVPSDRLFIGRVALELQERIGVTRQLVGLVMTTRGVLRGHQKVLIEGADAGEIKSGGFAPTLGCAIALARIPVGPFTQGVVDIRGKQCVVHVVKPPFVRKGKSCITIDEFTEKGSDHE